MARRAARGSEAARRRPRPARLPREAIAGEPARVAAALSIPSLRRAHARIPRDDGRAAEATHAAGDGAALGGCGARGGAGGEYALPRGTMNAREALAKLEELRNARGEEAAAAKKACLAVLARRSAGTARAVTRLHEALCFLRAYPDDAEVLQRVVAMLAGFARRPDLRRHARALEGTGIAGTAIRFPFFAGTARW